MDKSLIVGLVQSAVRMVLAWAAAAVGYQAVEGELDKGVAILAAIILSGGSLAWSYAEKKAWWKKAPPEAGK
jgi:hypothetical protein